MDTPGRIMRYSQAKSVWKAFLPPRRPITLRLPGCGWRLGGGVNRGVQMFSRVVSRRADQVTVMSGDLANTAHSRGRRVGVAGIALVAALLGASAAQAQNCNLTPNPLIFNLPAIGSSPASLTSMIGATVTAADTA